MGLAAGYAALDVPRCVPDKGWIKIRPDLPYAIGRCPDGSYAIANFRLQARVRCQTSFGGPKGVARSQQVVHSWQLSFEIRDTFHMFKASIGGFRGFPKINLNQCVGLQWRCIRDTPPSTT